jgi:hypothetical protein
VPLPSDDALPDPDVRRLPPILPPELRDQRAERHRPRGGRACERDGIPLRDHAACVLCGVLSGPRHPLALELVGGRCVECR